MIKRSLSVILAFIMMLSCMTILMVPATAVETPTGTAIDSLDDITDLTADYYLSADIGSEEDLNAVSVGDTSNAFTGTLNGNGKTIYTSVPVFSLLGAGSKVTNLTVRGEINATENIANVRNSSQQFLSCGAIACASKGAFTITDCVNYATVKYTVASNHANIGGFVGYAYAGGNVMTNCINYGNITHVSGASSQGRVGGMIGFGNAQATSPVSTSVFTSCKNYATITDESNMSLIGGMLGHYNSEENLKFVDCANYGDMNGKSASGGKVGGLISVFDRDYHLEFINCVNDAELFVTKTQSGGLISDCRSQVTFTDCTNKGSITVDQKVANNYAGGMAAIIQTSNKERTFINCTNEAPIESSHYIGGLAGKIAGGETNLYGCVNKGAINIPETCEVATFSGGVIGEFAAAKDLYMENCKNIAVIDVKTTHGTNLMGGIVGRGEVAVNMTFKNCANEGNISAVADAAGSKIGGIVGCIGKSGQPGYTTYIGCVNTGNVLGHAYVGGIVGQERVSARLIACVNGGNVSVTGTNAAGAAGMIASVPTVTMYSCINNGTLTNEKTAENVYDLCKDSSSTFVSDAETTVSVEFEGIQRSIKVENETTFAVRFITSITDIDQYLSTGVLVYVSEKDSADVKYVQKDTETVYTQIGAVENGVNTVYPATPVDGKYFAALTVDELSVSGSYTFIVIPYTVAIEGSVKAYGDAYTVQVTDGEIAFVEKLV